MKHHHTYEVGTGKKDPLCRSFYSYRPSAGAALRSVPTQQTIHGVAPTLQLLTISLAVHHLHASDRQGMASLAILASLGSVHIDAFGHVGIV